MGAVTEGILSVEQRIRQCCDLHHRVRESVSLLAVSKKQSIQTIEMAYQAGLRHFGENYVQEALTKIEVLAHLPDLCWHFIGPLQANKTALVAQHFAWVHSVDRIKIVRRLHEQRPAHLPALNLCVQINIDNEPSKSGVMPDQLISLVEAIVPLERVCLKGLMVIPKHSDSHQQQRYVFARMADALQVLQHRFPDLPLQTLSMGMSHDFEAGIAEGATWIRVGTALFGKRS